MGEHNVRSESDSAELQHFMKQLIEESRALEKMLEDDLFETGVTRIGAEQVMFLVDENHQPSLKAPEILDEIDDDHFTTELARFNLEWTQAALEQQKKLEVVGGVAYLASLDLELPDLGRLENYVEIVKERSVRRRLIEACGAIPP